MHAFFLKKEIELEGKVEKIELKKCEDSFMNYALNMREFIKLQGDNEVFKKKDYEVEDKFLKYALKMRDIYKGMENEENN